MYNCIQSQGRLPDAADCSRLYTVEFKLFDPWILLISYGRILFEQYSVSRHVNSSYLRFLTKIPLSVLSSVSVSKTYRHLRLGGIASGAGIIGQQNYVPVAELCHVFYSIVVESDHNFTKCSSLPCFLMSLTTSRVLIKTVAVLSQG